MLNSNIEKFITLDGSIGLYNKELDEIYHDRNGAIKESFEKFIEPCLKLDFKPLKILDICYGIGYNTKSALKYFKNIEFIDCIEIDKNLVTMSCQIQFDDDINKIIENNLKNPTVINFYLDDVRKIINNLNKKYDIIFHDGFAPMKQPELWSEDIITLIIDKLDKNGLYVTYNHSKPVLNALAKTGLTLGYTIKNNRKIGTIASFNSNLIENKLDNFELACLKTKSAITFKDKTLNLSKDEIFKNRENEVNNSTLESLSHLLKRMKKWKRF